MSNEHPNPIEKTAPSADEYKKIEEMIVARRAELPAAPIDRMGELMAEIQQLESQRVEAFGSSHEEGTAENDRMNAEGVAFDTAYEEATIENGARIKRNQQKPIE